MILTEYDKAATDIFNSVSDIISNHKPISLEPMLPGKMTTRIYIEDAPEIKESQQRKIKRFINCVNSIVDLEKSTEPKISYELKWLGLVGVCTGQNLVMYYIKVRYSEDYQRWEATIKNYPS